MRYYTENSWDGIEQENEEKNKIKKICEQFRERERVTKWDDNTEEQLFGERKMITVKNSFSKKMWNENREQW